MSKKYLKINKKIREAYKNSNMGDILVDLKSNFKGLDFIIYELESIMNLLFLRSLWPENNYSTLSLHMAFSGSSGTGKTYLGERIGPILRELNYLSKGQFICVNREDLLGEYVGHTAPKTKEILERSFGGILFIDEASRLYQADNSKDYGREAVEMILQIMENHRNDLALIFSDEKMKLTNFFEANPGLSSRIAHYIDFPNYSLNDLKDIFSFLLKKEGQFFLDNEDQRIKNILISELNKLQNSSNYANIRSLENLTHKILTYQAERLYNEVLVKKYKIGAKNLFKIENADFLIKKERKF